MKFRLLDLLACPVEGHSPLLVEVGQVVGGDTPPAWAPAEGRFCTHHCARPEGVRDCRGCWGLELVSGALLCPKCGARYPVVDGLPSLLPSGCADKAGAEERTLRDEQAEEYDRSYPVERNRVEVPATLRLLRLGRGDLLLETGAGTGRLTELCARRCREVVALDFSAASLAVAARRLRGAKGRVHLVHGDLLALPFREGAFDCYLAAGVFQHLPGAQRRGRGLEELRRVVRPGGRAVLTVYNYSVGKRRLDRQSGGAAREREGHHSGGRVCYRRFEARELRGWLEGALEVKRVVGFRMPRAERMGALGLVMEWLLERSPLGAHLGYNLAVECRRPAGPAGERAAEALR